MLELTSEILAKSNIVNSVEDFSTKFENQYIDSFSVIIKQGLESGQIVKILEDIGIQLKDLKHMLNEKEKKKVANQILVCQLLIYVGVIILTMFVMVGALGSMSW
jgi:pilus assembly protein TadC